MTMAHKVFVDQTFGQTPRSRSRNGCAKRYSDCDHMGRAALIMPKKASAA